MSKIHLSAKDLLLIVDVQNDFLPGGALGVDQGDQVIAPINRIAGLFNTVIATQDWHPAGHRSFASSHPGKQPFDVIDTGDGTETLWPDHCVQDSTGAEFAKALDTRAVQTIIRKGFRPHLDSYSAFFENDRRTTTGLSSLCRERSITRVHICGLATDFCVYWTAMDARTQGFDVVLYDEACRGIDRDGSLRAAMDDMLDHGVRVAKIADIEELV